MNHQDSFNLQQLRDEISASVNACIMEGGHAKYDGPNLQQLQAAISALYTSEKLAFTFCANSGTTALEVALRALGVGVGDSVCLSGYDYPGNFWAIERCGARPLLVDVQPDGWSIDQQLDAKLDNRNLPKAIVVSHLHGHLQPMDQLADWCGRRGIALIEDCCQSFGTQRNGRMQAIIGDIGVLSFGGGKVVSCGRGGALVTHDESVFQRIKLAAGAGSGPNHLSEIQAASLLPQIERLASLASMIDHFGRDLLMFLDSDAVHAICLQMPEVVYAAYQFGMLTHGIERNLLIDRLRERGVPAGAGFSGFHKRSIRRCDHLTTLNNVASVAQRTVTIHHSVVWESQARDVGQLINQIATELLC